MAPRKQSCADLVVENIGTKPFSSVAIAVTRAFRIVKYIWRHPANRNKRLAAIGRAVKFQARGRLLGKPTTVRLGKNSFVLAYLHRTAASKVVYGNPPDYAEMLVWQRTLKDGDLFVDVGANIGTYSIWAAEHGARVIAIEPASETFPLLAKNISMNNYQITAIQAGAAAECGSSRFTSGLDCVNRLCDEGNVEIKVVSIDSLIGSQAIAGMKVDVEGHELAVLSGCHTALADRRVKLMQLEWNSTSEVAVGTDRLPIAELLDNYGYKLYRPDERGMLFPVNDLNFGADVFAMPQGHE